MGSLRLLCVLLSTIACTSTPTASVPYQNDFENPALGKEWTGKRGRWQVVEGRLFNDGARNEPLWLSASLPKDVRISFTAESRSPAVDLKFEVFGNGKDHQSGYVVILSGWNNSKSIIARRDEHGPERTPGRTAALKEEVRTQSEQAFKKYADQKEIIARPHRGEPNRRYRLRFEREGNSLRFFVDDALHLEYFDPAPLFGSGQDRFAFSNWMSEVYFDDLLIEPL